MDLKEAFHLLGIPEEVRRAYENKGLKSLYQWQADCLLSTNVLRGDNLLYCAPTSGGKTMVAELILLKTALVLRKQVIFVLPFVSLVFEKEQYLQKLFSNFNRANSLMERIRVRSYYGGKPIKQAKRANVMVCTIEKANGLINYMLERGKLKELGCVIVDEAHVISNSLNGYMLEILISKLKFINNSISHRNKFQMERPIQLIAMSATVGNVDDISSWLQSKLYISNFRPVPLYEFIKVGNEIYGLDGNVVNQIINPFHGDNDDLGYLCFEAIDRQQQVLVFCPTKAQCSINCRLIVTVLNLAKKEVPDFVVEQRKAVVAEIERFEIAGAFHDTLLKESILHGVAFHNSNLDQNVREIIERAYLSGIILVLVATTTLAAGVNLPAGRVIITSMLLGRDPLTIGHYKQMVGRAGRAGHCNFGESFLLVRKGELAKAFHLTHQALPNIDSALGPARDGGNAVLRMLIESTGLGLVETVTDAINFMAQTLFFHLIAVSSKDSILQRLVTSSINFLRDGYIMQLETGKIDIDANKSIRLILTKLGKALMKAGIDTDEGIIIYEGLFRSQQGLVLDSSLHLLYLISPYNFPLVPNYIKLASVFDKSAKLGKNKLNSDSDVMTAVGLDFGQLSRWLARPPTYTDVQQSSDLLRQGFLQLFAELCREALITTEEETNLIDTTRTAATTQRKRLSHNECKLLCASRRFWCALILRKVLDGFPFDAIVREFECSRLDIENLIRDARIKLQVTKKLCDEMGWSAISNILSAFAVELKFDDVKLVGSLLTIEGMTHKMARILVNNGISSVEKVAELSPEDLTQYFMLSLGFHLQDKESINTEFLFDDELSNFDDTSDHDKDQSCRRVTDRDETSDGRPTKMAKTEGDFMILRMDTLTKLLVANAKKLVSESMTTTNMSNEDSSIILELDDVNDLDEEALMMALQVAEQEHLKISTESIVVKAIKNNECEDHHLDEDQIGSSSSSSTISDVNSDSYASDNDEEKDEDEEEEHMDSFLKIHHEVGASQIDEDIVVPIGDYEEGESFVLDESDAPLSIGSAVFTPKSQYRLKTQSGEVLMIREKILTLNISTGRRSNRNHTKRLKTLVCESDLADLISNLESKTDLIQMTQIQQESPNIDVNSRAELTHVAEFVQQHQIVDNEACGSKFDDITIDISCYLQDSHFPAPAVRFPNNEVAGILSVNRSVSKITPEFSIIPIQSETIIKEPIQMEGDEINDTILMQLMEDLESHKMNQSTVESHSHQSTRGKLNSSQFRHDHNVVANHDSPYVALGANEGSKASNRDTSVPWTAANHDARYIVIGNKNRKFSPYLTPFAAATRHHITFGTYLYLPSMHPARNEKSLMDNNTIGSGSKVSALFEIEDPSTILSNLRLESNIRMTEMPQMVANLKIDSLNISSSAFSSLLEQVQAKKVFSFELIFREIPTWLLFRKWKKENNASDSSLFKLWSFTHLVSQFCFSATNITCNISDLALPNVIHDYVPGNTKKCHRKGDKQVLSGMVLYCGDSQAFHLSLPMIPLIDEREANAYLKNLKVVSIGKSSPGGATWSELPLPALVRIALYVGFSSTLKQSLHFVQYFESRQEKISKSEQSFDARKEYLSNRNDMWFVCKSWCVAMHISVVEAWKTGQALPWMIVNDLFRDPSICKMSNHIKNKLQCLRERDIISQGHLLDPAIAFSLLPEEYRDKYDQKYASPRTLLQQKAQQEHHFSHFHRPFNFLERLGLCVAATRAAICWRAVVDAEVSLQKHELLGIFHNIEMPLTIAVSDMEMNGISINARWLREMKNIIEDRQRTIESLVHHYFLNKKKFNLDSVSDVRDIQKHLPAMVLPLSHEPLLCATQDTNDFDEEKVDKKKSKSDWSTEKSKFTDKENPMDIDQRLSNPFNAIDKDQKTLVPKDTEMKDVKVCEHIIMMLIREHRRHVKLLPMLISLLRNQRKHRVYGYFHQLGTITGRMIASHPPLQQIPKESSFIPSVRMTLQHELLHSWNDAKRPPWTYYLEHINNTLRSKNMTSDKSFSSKEWVRILPVEDVSKKTFSSTVDINYDDNANIDANMEVINSITEEFSVGILLEILHVPPVYPITNPNNNKLIFGGFDLDGLVAVVQLGSDTSPSIPSVGDMKRIVQYPASRVRRLNAAIQATVTETALFQHLITVDKCHFRFANIGMNKGLSEENSMERIKERQDLCDKYLKLYETRHVREGFTASAGYVLIAADYCQIELRMLAHLSMDEDLCAAFHSGQDVFKDMASRWLRKSYDSISDVERHRIKQICYSLLYGAGPGLIAASADVSIEDAEKLLFDFEQKFPGISGFVTSVKNEAQKTGKVRTILGRQRWLPELRSKIFKIRSAGERRAVNTLCQGSAADLIKLAMINIHCKLEEWSQESLETYARSQQAMANVVHFHQKRSFPGGGLYRKLDDVRLILQIHDELVYEVRPEHVDKVACIIRECMEQAVLLHVPLQVKLSVGNSWGSMQPLQTVSSSEAEKHILGDPSPHRANVHHTKSPFSPTDADVFPNYDLMVTRTTSTEAQNQLFMAANSVNHDIICQHLYAISSSVLVTKDAANVKTSNTIAKNLFGSDA